MKMRLPEISAAVAVIVGSLALAGWVFDLPDLRSVLPHLSTMKPNTAIAFVLSGLALALPRGNRLGAACVATAGLIGTLTLLEYLLGSGLGIDQLILADHVTEPTALPGRPGINTALCFSLLSIPLSAWQLGWRRPRWLPEAGAIGAGLIALAALIGYVYSAAAPTGLASYTQMALHTAALFVLLSAGVLARGPGGPLMTIAAQPGPADVIVRRLFPTMIVVLLILGWIMLKGQEAGFYGTEFGLASVMLATTALLGVVVFWSAARLTRDDQGRRASEAMYRSLVENSPYGILRASLDGRLLAANPTFVRMLGYDDEAELLRVDVVRDVYMLDPDELQRRLSIVTAGGVLTGESPWKRKNGSTFIARRSSRMHRGPAGEVQHIDVFVEDVSEQRAIETQLQQARKMEAIGRLAGGVAHDFNNLLTIVLSASDLLLETLAADAPERHDVADIHEAAIRAADLTRQLLAFSRQQVLQPIVLDLNGVIGGMEKMLRRLIGEDVALRVGLQAGLGAVRADPGQVEQILLNLAVNARDAMPDGGQLTIETGDVELDATYAATHVTALPGPYCMLAVSDTGVGMDRATQARIFEPFFTTKEQGKGTGLGLATVYGIVKQSGGHIWLYSEPGQGATFKIYLPRVTEPLDARMPAPSAKSLVGTETILLVEDEAMVRSVAQRVLEGQGYTVLSAPDGNQGLAIAQEHQGDIHLLLSDVVLPTLGGGELARQVGKMRPTTRVLLISGYTGESIVRRGIVATGTPFLQKPFTIQSLASKVREVLDA